ncbi:MAG: hypothetical protein Q9175_006784 [Cornicularia normoerica]
MDSLRQPDDSSIGVTLPALFPPAGVTSNFVNPISRGPRWAMVLAHINGTFPSRLSPRVFFE